VTAFVPVQIRLVTPILEAVELGLSQAGKRERVQIPRHQRQPRELPMGLPFQESQC